MAGNSIDLEYSITKKILKGTVLGEKVNAKAESGFGAGGKKFGAASLQNDPDLTYIKSRRISSSVGLNRQNRYYDVKIIQSMLNDAITPSPNLKADGKCGPKTIAAIKRFQQLINITPDGWMAPDKTTFQKLLLASRHFTVTVYDFENPENDLVTYRGGPPPVGLYKLTLKANHNNRIDMQPQFKTHRGGLQIHGTGQIGSDGCIVVFDHAVLKQLIKAMSDANSAQVRIER